MFAFAAPGTVVAGLGLLVQNDTLFKAGGAFMVAGGLWLVITIEKIIRFGKETSADKA